jgi:CARDB
VKRPILAAALLAALVVASAATAADRPARVVMPSCTQGLDIADRSVVYEGRMRRIAGTRKMQMRFALQWRQPGSTHWTAVKAPGLGSWVSSDAGVKTYTFTKRIENLAAPATYRVLVRFRWLDARGHRLGSDQVASKSCRQPDLRPNLVPKRVYSQRIGDPASRRYVVVVRNAGATAAGPFDVGLGALAPGHTVDLGPGVSTLGTFEGPRCDAPATLTATVDPGGLVDEADEDDNTLTVPCPVAAG